MPPTITCHLLGRLSEERLSAPHPQVGSPAGGFWLVLPRIFSYLAAPRVHIDTFRWCPDITVQELPFGDGGTRVPPDHSQSWRSWT
jgi:hypothetical protein